MFARKAYASGEAPLREGATPGLERGRVLRPRSGVVRLRHARGGRRDRPDTCNLVIRRYVSSTTAEVINPMVVAGQMYGGFAQGLGGAYYERIAYDESGQIVNASFMDFLIPYATEVPGRWCCTPRRRRRSTRSASRA